MQNGPTRRQTVEFQAYPGWEGAPQTMDIIPVPALRTPQRPHANLRHGAMTFLDVANQSFRLEESSDWRDLLPYSVGGFVAGWLILGVIAWLM